MGWCRVHCGCFLVHLGRRIEPGGVPWRKKNWACSLSSWEGYLALQGFQLQIQSWEMAWLKSGQGLAFSTHPQRMCRGPEGHSRSLLPSLSFPRPRWQWRWWQKCFKGMRISADKCLFSGNFLFITSLGVSGMFLLREVAVSRRF